MTKYHTWLFIRAVVRWADSGLRRGVRTDRGRNSLRSNQLIRSGVWIPPHCGRSLCTGMLSAIGVAYWTASLLTVPSSADLIL